MKEVFPGLGQVATEALKDLGFNVDSLTGEFASAFDGLRGLENVAAPAAEKLKNDAFAVCTPCDTKKAIELANESMARAKALDIDLERIHAGDRLSARDLAKTKGTLVQTALTVLFCSVFAVLMGQIFTGQEVVHSSMRDIANFLLGTLTGILMQQMNFWFGSSSGSKEKTQKLEGPK